jgi:glycosyltransferase involved in cell wall biosynthesis
MNPDFRYSVVIPAHDAAATIGAAIASVLVQSVPPERIVVVDDGSRDHTTAVARSSSDLVQVLVQPNAGPGAATTRGLAEVATPLVAFLDADDLWLPDKVQRQIGHLEANPALAGVCSWGRHFVDDTPASDGAVQEIWGRTSLMIRTEYARTVGPVVDPPGGRGDMVDWLKRAREAGFAIAMLDEILVLRRVRRDSMSYGRGAGDIGYLHVVKAALDRKRARQATGK